MTMEEKVLDEILGCGLVRLAERYTRSARRSKGLKLKQIRLCMQWFYVRTGCFQILEAVSTIRIRQLRSVLIPLRK